MSYVSYATPTQVNNSVFGIKAAVQSLAFGIILGTGSSMVSAMPSARVSVYAKLPNATSEDRQNIEADVGSLVSAQQHLTNIKKGIGLQMSELAGLFGVSRQSVHKWQTGIAIPGAEYIATIQALSSLADDLTAKCISRPADLVRAKAFQGSSILDLIAGKKDFVEPLKALVSESKLIDERYAAVKTASLNIPRTSDWQSSISVPYASDI